MRDSPTARQLEFVEHYPSGPRGVRFNATAAARAAGYAWPDRQGPRLRTMPLVAWLIRTGMVLRHLAARDAEGELVTRPRARRGAARCAPRAARTRPGGR